MKRCTKCWIEKQLDSFSKHKLTTDMKQSNCKDCQIEQVILYQKTKKWLVSILYNSQKGSSKKRGHSKPCYTRKEFQNWLLTDVNFEELYNNWVKSWYIKDLKPSVDRLKNDKPYALDNIQLVTWKENRKNYYHDKRNWLDNKYHTVFKYDLEWNFIKKYSIKEVKIQIWIKLSNIYSCCRGERKTAWWFIWKFQKTN